MNLRTFHRLMRKCAEHYDARYFPSGDADRERGEYVLERPQSAGSWSRHGTSTFRRHVSPALSIRGACTGTYTNGRIEYNPKLVSKQSDAEAIEGVAWAISGYVWTFKGRRSGGGKRAGIIATCRRICVLELAKPPEFGPVSPTDKKSCGVVADKLEEAGNPLAKLLR